MARLSALTVELMEDSVTGQIVRAIDTVLVSSSISWWVRTKEYNQPYSSFSGSVGRASDWHSWGPGLIPGLMSMFFPAIVLKLCLSCLMHRCTLQKVMQLRCSACFPVALWVCEDHCQCYYSCARVYMERWCSCTWHISPYQDMNTVHQWYLISEGNNAFSIYQAKLVVNVCFSTSVKQSLYLDICFSTRVKCLQIVMHNFLYQSLMSLIDERLWKLI